MTTTPARIPMTGLLAANSLRRLLDLLAQDGDTAYIVGGAVRNALVGRPVHEIDIATSATPSLVMARAESAGFKTIPTGIDHGTVTVMVDHTPYEVTTFRSDIATDGRRATVLFGRDILPDAERRDFTINSLYADQDGVIIDLVGGLADIAARRVRFIGDPVARIREDYLRILRFFRFQSDYAEGAPDAAALAASKSEKNGLDTLSRERIRAEFLKILCSRRAVETVALMAETGILPHVIDQSPDINTLRHLVAFHPASDAILRLAALAVRSVPDCESLRDKLRLSNHEFATLKAIATALPALPDTPESAPPQQLRALSYRHGHTHALDALRIKLAMHGTTMPDSVRTLIESAPDSCPFTGAMLLATGLAPGQHIGKIITAAETEWIAQDFPSDPATRDTILANAVKQHA